MKKKLYTVPVPTESEEQIMLFNWVIYKSGKYPVLNLLFHIPNGGKRGKAEAGRFRAEGVKAGVPDLFLPAPIGKYHGLFIELKRRKESKTSEEQKNWIRDLSKQGYCAKICFGWEHASEEITKYLESKQ